MKERLQRNTLGIALWALVCALISPLLFGIVEREYIRLSLSRGANTALAVGRASLLMVVLVLVCVMFLYLCCRFGRAVVVKMRKFRGAKLEEGRA